MCNYRNYTDKECIEALTGEPAPAPEFVKYFFYEKSKSMLQHISKSLYGNDEYRDLVSEYYIYLENNNWYVLRQFKHKNDASLISYLSRCTFNYFVDAKEIRKHEQLLADSIEYIYEDVDHDKERMFHAISIAYTLLKEPHKKTIELLVLKGMKSLDAADFLWKYTKHKDEDWRALPRKSVQDIIATKKQSACAALSAATFKILDELDKKETVFTN